MPPLREVPRRPSVPLVLDFHEVTERPSERCPGDIHDTHIIRARRQRLLLPTRPLAHSDPARRIAKMRVVNCFGMTDDLGPYGTTIRHVWFKPIGAHANGLAICRTFRTGHLRKCNARRRYEGCGRCAHCRDVAKAMARQCRIFRHRNGLTPLIKTNMASKQLSIAASDLRQPPIISIFGRQFNAYWMELHVILLTRFSGPVVRNIIGYAFQPLFASSMSGDA